MVILTNLKPDRWSGMGLSLYIDRREIFCLYLRLEMSVLIVPRVDPDHLDHGHEYEEVPDH